MDLSVLTTLPKFVVRHLFYKCENISSVNYEGKIVQEGATDVLNAVVVSSKIKDSNWHRPLLDLDFECELLPSSTPGKHHLYINKVLTFEELEKLVKVMTEVGLINQGVYDNQIKKDKQLTLRLPWVKKGEELSLNQQDKLQEHNDWVDKNNAKSSWQDLLA